VQLRLRLLGPVQAEVGGRPVDLGHAVELYEKIGDKLSKTKVLADLERHRVAPRS
jgi:hypothetical protein